MRNRRSIFFLYACVLLVVGCQRERVTNQPPPSSAAKPTTTATAVQDLSNAKVKSILPTAAAPVDKCVMGSTLDAAGNVATEQRSFKPAEPIRITMWLHDSPAGLQTSAHWMTDKGKELTKEQKMMNGAKIATFTLDKKLKPGKYSVTGLWGGNDACDFDFVVTKK